MAATRERERERDRLGLRADCDACFALCCVALHVTRSAEFALDKPAGEPCANLGADFRCGIHAELRERGFSGCTVFDCLGAGQKVSRLTFAGTDWRDDADVARRMFAVFPVMRQLHELLWYLTEALALPAARSLHADLRRAIDHVDKLTQSDAESMLKLDVATLHGEINALLTRASELARAGLPGRKRDHRNADLTGARLRGADLRGANLRGARLIAADLRNADLRSADVTGADLRNADVRGADLTGALFLTQAQLDAARGDALTKLSMADMEMDAASDVAVASVGLRRPGHWQSS